MSYTGIHKRIERIISDKAMRNQYTQVCMSKDIRKGTIDVLTVICDIPEESAVLLTDRIMAIPPADIRMNSSDIISFFKNNYGV